MFKLYRINTHFTCQQCNAQNPSSQASAVDELTSRCSNWIQKRQRNQRSNCQHLLDHKKAREFQRNLYFCFIDYEEAFDCVDHNKLWKMLKEMGNTRQPYLPPEKLVCRSRSNSYTGQGITDWFKFGKGVWQGCILLPCLFNLYAEYIMGNPGLDKA